MATQTDVAPVPLSFADLRDQVRQARTERALAKQRCYLGYAHGQPVTDADLDAVTRVQVKVSMLVETCKHATWHEASVAECQKDHRRGLLRDVSKPTDERK